MKRFFKHSFVYKIISLLLCALLLSVMIPRNVSADEEEDLKLLDKFEQMRKEEEEAKKSLGSPLEKSRIYEMMQDFNEAEIEEQEKWKQFGLDGDPTKNIPDDADSGEYAEYKNKDGSVTKVYDNGSVATQYADGSIEAVDYKGNRITYDSDGKETIYTVEGNTIRQIDENRMEIEKPGGASKVTLDTKNETITQNVHGFCKEHNMSGDLTYYFEGSDQKLVQKYGEDLVGELKGKDGESLFADEKGVSLRTGDGMEVERRYVDDGKNDYTETDIKFPNGFTSFSGEGTYYEKVDGKKVKVDRIWQSVTEADGRTFEMEYSGTPEEGSTRVRAAAEWKAQDGSKLWVDFMSQAMEYKDNETGTTLVQDENGNVTRLYVKDEVDHTGTYDKKGNLLESTTIYRNDSKIIAYSDGSISMETPEGTYFSDGKGNVFKDGVLVKHNGMLVENPEVYGYTEVSKDEEFAPKVNEILGSWDVTLTFSNIHSEWVESIIAGITEFLPDEAADAVEAGVTYYVDENSVIPVQGHMNIEAGSDPNEVKVTLYTMSTSGYWVTSVYKGTLEKGHMKLKLTQYHDPAGDEGAMTAGIERLEFEFYGQGERRYINGTYNLDSHALSADIAYTGERVSSDSLWSF